MVATIHDQIKGIIENRLYSILVRGWRSQHERAISATWSIQNTFELQHSEETEGNVYKDILKVNVKLIMIWSSAKCYTAVLSKSKVEIQSAHGADGVISSAILSIE